MGKTKVKERTFWFVYGIHYRNWTENRVKENRSKNTSNLKRLVELKFGSIAKQNVINLYSYKPDEKELYALSFGFNFALPQKIDKDITYLEFENFLKQTMQHKPISKEAESCFKAKLVAETNILLLN